MSDQSLLLRSALSDSEACDRYGDRQHFGAAISEWVPMFRANVSQVLPGWTQPLLYHRPPGYTVRKGMEMGPCHAGLSLGAQIDDSPAPELLVFFLPVPVLFRVTDTYPVQLDGLRRFEAKCKFPSGFFSVGNIQDLSFLCLSVFHEQRMRIGEGHTNIRSSTSLPSRERLGLFWNHDTLWPYRSVDHSRGFINGTILLQGNVDLSE